MTDVGDSATAVKKQIDVRPIGREIYTDWILKRHYAHRLPLIQYAYGSFVNRECVAVITYGQPATNFVAKSVVQEQYRGLVLELNRLIVGEDQPRNTASQLVAASLKMLPKPAVIVSYADEGQGHVGYVYQATNFTYCGKTAPHRNDYISPTGEKIHPRTMQGWKGVNNLERWVEENGWTKEKPSFKHRYVYVTGSKSQKREITKCLLWDPEPYPKGETRRYSADAEIPSQVVLF